MRLIRFGTIPLNILIESIMAKKEYVCDNCHHIGPAISKTPGSIFFEIVLWIIFILPGVLYSIYRLISKKQVCSVCESDQLIPIDSPRGKELVDQINSKQSSVTQ